MIRRRLLCLLLLLVPSGLFAGALDLNLNDDAVRFGFSWPLAAGRLSADAGWLHHQDNGDVVGLGLHRVGKPAAGSIAVEAGVGGKVFYVDPESSNLDGTALGLGGFARFSLPGNERIVFGAGIYFAPDVLAFGDVEKYREAELHAGYTILEGADIYLGYRYSKSSYEELDSVTFDTDLHLGLRVSF